MERVCVDAGINPLDTRYTEYIAIQPYTVSMVIYAENSSEKPRQIVDPVKFSKTPF